MFIFKYVSLKDRGETSDQSVNFLENQVLSHGKSKNENPYP